MSAGPLSDAEIILDQTGDGGTRRQVRRRDETVWPAQKLMADLLGLLDAEVKKLPQSRKPKPKKP